MVSSLRGPGLLIVAAVAVLTWTACGTQQQEGGGVRTRARAVAGCDYATSPSFSLPSATTSPGPTEEVPPPPQLRTDPRLGSDPQLLAGRTGAWLVGSVAEKEAETTGVATFVEATGKGETRTCDVPAVTRARVTAWGDRLVILGLDCQGCTEGTPTATVLDKNGASLFTWRDDVVMDADGFGARFVDLGASELVVMAHKLLTLHDIEGRVSSDETILPEYPPLLCPVDGKLLSVSQTNVDDKPSPLSAIRLALLDPANLRPTEVLDTTAAASVRFPQLACTDGGVAVVGLNNAFVWTMPKGWTDLSSNGIKGNDLVGSDNRFIIERAGELEVLTSDGWQKINGRSTPFIKTSASQSLAVVMDPRGADTSLSFTTLQ